MNEEPKPEMADEVEPVEETVETEGVLESEAELDIAAKPAPVQPLVTKAVPPLPAELSNLKRPKAAGNLLENIFLLLFAIPWTLCSLSGLFMMGGTLIRDYSTYYRLRDEGQTVRGTVTQLSIDDSDDSVSYAVSYRFKAPIQGDWTTFDGYDSVSETVYRQLETGGSLEVIYVASEPAVSAVKADWRPPDNSMIIFMVLWGTFGLGIGGFMLVRSFRAGKEFLDLRSRGQLTQAIVFDKWEVSGSENSSCYVAYAYRIPGFGKQLLTSAQQSYQAYKKLQPGETVSIRYLPDKPQVCCLVDFWW